jgi:hypothetical protein
MPTPSLLIVPARFKTGKLYSQIPTSGAGDFTVTRNTTATRLNDAGVIESVASGIPRLDYSVSGFVTGCPALLVEPAATNEIRNNSNTNAVTGTPGTLPTNWTETLAGLTRSVIALGAENGVQYIDIRLSGTANATEAIINFESPTQTVASNGQVWTNSCFLKSISAPVPYTGLRLSTVERTSGGVFVASGNSPDLTLTSTLNRFSFTRTLSGGGTVARVQSRISFGLVSGTAYDFTVRIGYPQMELGSVATSVIPTTAGTGSRSADVISVSGAVSGSIGQTAGTAYLEIVAVSGTNSGRVLSLTESGAPTNNRIAFTIDASNHRLEVIVRSSGSITNGSIGSSAATLLVNGVNKIAYAYDGVAGSNALAINGSVVATNSQTLAFTQALSRVNVAILESDLTVATNQRIRAVALYTTRLTNAELATLTTP